MEVLVFKLLSVDALAPSPVLVREIPSLDHEALDDWGWGGAGGYRSLHSTNTTDHTEVLTILNTNRTKVLLEQCVEQYSVLTLECVELTAVEGAALEVQRSPGGLPLSLLPGAQSTEVLRCSGRDIGEQLQNNSARWNTNFHQTGSAAMRAGTGHRTGTTPPSDQP